MANAEIALSVRGGREFKDLAAKLRKAGRSKELTRYIRAELQRAAKPAVVDARRHAIAILPKRGGLASLVAQANMTISVRGGGNSAGVRIVAKRKDMEQLALIDRGLVVHPTYGHRPRTAQRVPSGWFTDPMSDQAEPMRAGVFRAIDKLIGELGG